MSENRDKRRRSDLDLFVLALVESGISTPYELKTAADLSPGATIPALRRLLGDGLVVRGDSGPRGRMEHEITAAGRRRLKNGWRDLIDHGPSGDLDADLRVALLGLFVGGDRRLARDFLCRSAARKTDLAKSAIEMDDSESMPPLAAWYQKLRGASAQALIKGEIAAALVMARALPKKQGRKRHEAEARRYPAGCSKRL